MQAGSKAGERGAANRWKQLEGAPITELTMGRRQGTAKEGAHWEKFRF